MRKTVTFDQEIYEKLQKMRAQALMEGHNMSFTEAVNLTLLEALTEREKHARIA